MEEFGCTNDSRQAYADSQGVWHMDKWQLDLMIDRYGNQVHIAYQKHTVNNVVLDSAMTDITYDDPGCHNTVAACSSWHPQVDIHFDAGQKVTRLLGGNCGNWTPPNGNVRCDDPHDDSGSGGLPAPKVMGAYVLNDVQVKVNGNLLSEYDLSYNQGGPSGYTDPATGQSESIAGFLTLGKIETRGTGDTSLNAPTLTMQYQQISEHYSDLFSYATPSTNCSPYGSAPRDGSATGPCYLWAMTYHQYYLSNLDNGAGWNESISWKEAHANTWGIDAGGAVNNTFICTTQGQTSTNNCGRADDKSWSRIVVGSRTATTNGVSSTWSYTYYLQTGIQGASFPGYYTSRTCTSVCSQTYTWGNQNDFDYADYYNGAFQSFQQVQVILPDHSSQTDTYGATTGWGLANSSITCQTGANNCKTASYVTGTNGDLATVFAGRQQQEQDYDVGGHLLKQTNWSWTSNCPPLGVAGSVGAGGGGIDPGPGYLFSELDHNNPVLVCDPRVDHVDSYTTDGVTSNINDARVVHSTVTTSYDGNNQGVAAYDYGNVDRMDTTGNDVGGQQFVQTTSYFPDNNINGNVYLTDLPAFVQNRDAAGTIDGCQVYVYGGNPSPPHPPVVPSVTLQAGFVDAQNCGGTPSATLHSYDSSGNPITATDPDGHQGCTSGSTQYSACATYDGFGTHLTKALNAKNQAVTYHYDTSASGGYGQWLMSTTDANGQTTTYTYDVLGRVTSIVQPGDTPSAPTTTYTYTNTCTAGTTSPCLELDTTTRETSGSATTTTTSQWFDGMGRLVETQTPGFIYTPTTSGGPPPYITSFVTYTLYDSMGRATTQSLPYAVPQGLGLPVEYVTPDLTRARTVTSYDSQGRPLGSISYESGSQIASESTISYTVGQGIPSFNVDTSTAFERTTTLDAYNHQSVEYTDALGRDRYEQVFTGTGNPYGVVRTVQYNRDEVGNVTSTITFDATARAQAVRSSSYDGLQRVTGFNDSDAGSCATVPMPPSCSSSSDMASKVTYDVDDNVLSQTDPRNVTTYTSYDALDRPLCRGTASSQVNPCQSSAYATFFYDSYDNSSNAGVTFPVGCAAPGGTSDPVGEKVAETFSSAAGNGWRCNGYDARGQTIAGALSVTADGQTTTQNVSMTYNDLGAINSLTYPDGETVTSDFDGNGRLLSAYFGTAASSDPVAFLASGVSYTGNGQLAGLWIGGTGTKTRNASRPPSSVFSITLGYDGMQRPVSSSALSVAQPVGAAPFWSQQRTYDNAGNILQLSTTLATSSGSSLTDNQSFCYDALDRLTWAGNSGTPSGGDHCGSTPTGSTTPGYAQSFSYDELDRMTQGSAGTESYGDTANVHAVTDLSSIPNPYASYDAMGNMTCRNVDPSGSQSCASGAQTGATMSYDNEGRLTSWAAPTGITASDQFLYDNEGNRVLQRTSTTPVGSTTPTVTDTITFDGYSEVAITDGTPTITNYFSVAGQRVAMRKGAILSYLVPDFLGSSSVALNNDGTIQAVQLYAPYGSVRYSDQIMPTDYNFTGQRLDSQTGLLYDNARYYDPVSGRFISSDTVQNNTKGMDSYAYVGDNPVVRTDPSGKCYPLCTMLIGAAIGAVVGVAATMVSGAIQGKMPSGGEIAQAAVTGAVAGAITGLAGPEAGPLARVAIGAVASGAGQAVGNAMQGKPIMDGVGQAAIMGGLMEGGGALAGKIGGDVEEGAASTLEDTGCGLSFRADTLVTTPKGKQAIGTLKVGDPVQAYNPATKKVSTQTVQHVFINHDTDLIDVTLAVHNDSGSTKQQKVATISHGSHAPPVTTEVVHTTEKHPWLTTHGWITAGKLRLGDRIQQLDGRTAAVVALTVISGEQDMYDLTVSNIHTFAVGAGQWVVHNCGNNITLYRGTDNADELKAFSDSGGFMFSDAARSSYLSSREAGSSVEEALQAAQRASEGAHAAQLAEWGSLDNYVQQHALETVHDVGPRSLMSWTADSSIAETFGSNIFSVTMPFDSVIQQTLSTFDESEYLIMHMQQVTHMVRAS